MDKLKKIIFTILGVLMLLKLLGLNVDVFAIDYGYNKVDWSINSEGAYCTNDGYSIPLSGFDDFSGWKDLDATINLGDCNTMGILTFRVYGNSTYTFKAGNSYTIRYTVDFKDAWEASMFMQNYEFGRLLTNTTNAQTGGVYGYENVTSYNSYFKEGSVENRVLIYFTFTPSVDLQFVRTYYYPKDLTPISNTNLYVDSDSLVKQSVMLQFVKVTYVEGSNAAIENQTNTIINQTDKINDSINTLMLIFKNNSDKTEETLTDDSPPDDEKTSAFVDGMVGYLPPGPIDSILNLPLTFLNAYMSGLSGNCQPVNLQLPYVDENMQLACPNTILTKINGFGTLYDFIGIVASAYILLKYLMSLYVWVDRTLTFRENNEPGYFDEP